MVMSPGGVYVIEYAKDHSWAQANKLRGSLEQTDRQAPSEELTAVSKKLQLMITQGGSHRMS